MRNSVEVEIHGDKFTVTEITMRDMRPIMHRLKGEESEDAQIELMQACIELNGKPIGDGLLDLGVSAYLELQPIVMQVCGMEKDDGEQGKD